MPEERPTVVTIVAIGNLIAALLCSCTTLYEAATPAMMVAFRSVSQQAIAHQRQQLQRLMQMRQKAKTPQERQRIDAQIANLKKAMMPDLSKFAEPFLSPAIRWGYLVGGAVSLLINALLFVSGVGLLWLKRWAWWCALIACALQIVRNLGMAAFNIFVVTPASAKAVEAMMAEMTKAMPPGAPAFPVMPISPWMEFWSAIVQLLWLLLYSAWALVALFLLLLPDTRKAFQQ
ncbi:MAG: hypothetical protein PVTTEEND_000314 [Candidatus Fervidibacter sp.]|jgi:hypothetical protein